MAFPDPADLVARLRAAGCVFAEQEAALLLEAASDPVDRDALLARRVAGEPLEQVLGWVEFCGHRVAVAPGVFVPRRRSELLVAAALTRVGPGATVVDLCCGCGAVGLAVVRGLGRAVLHAVDVDPAAVACAAANLAPVGGRAHLGDLVAPLPDALRGRVDVLLAVTPYVPTAALATMPPEARDHEPRPALDGGPDGLAVLRRIAALAPAWLTPGGHLISEIAADQAGPALDVLTAAGLIATVERDDEQGATAVLGRR